jgi:Holliday junction resolvasome RuvABC ATP-dependent DNA helicase subunit
VIPAFDPALFAEEPEPDEPLITAPEPLLDPISEIQAEYAAATARTTPRPETWDEIIGNRRAVTICRQACAAAKAQGKPLPHILLFGPPGVGKTTLSKQIAREMQSSFFETTASTLRTPTDRVLVDGEAVYTEPASNAP